MTVPLENVRGFACVQPKRRSRTCALTLKDERQSWAGRELVGMPSGIPSAERAYRLRVFDIMEVPVRLVGENGLHFEP